MATAISIQVMERNSDMLLNPKTEKYEHLDERSREIMLKTIEFFEAKGKEGCKEALRSRTWHQDFFDFTKDNHVFAELLTPAKYAAGRAGVRWDTARICDFNEILGFYGLSYWYAWQVSILGLGPIWMGGNEKVKQKTAELLDQGGIFAFGLSERAHGADLYSSEMMLTPLGEGRYVADGGKYYIGNANEAAYVSTFGKNSETDEYVFFVPDIPGLREADHYQAMSYLRREISPGQKVLVVGGGLVGCEIAELLADEEKEVALIDVLPEMAGDIGPSLRGACLDRLESKKVTMLPNTKINRVEGRRAVLTINPGKDKTIEFDSILLAHHDAANLAPKRARAW